MNPCDDASDRPRLITRRAALIGGGAAAFALTLPGQALARRRRQRLRSHLRRSSYTGLVGERFRVAGSSTRLTLVSVSGLTAHQANSENAFALVFRAARGAKLVAVNHPVTLVHPALGRFPFLLTAGQASFRGQDYLVIVNRLHA